MMSSLPGKIMRVGALRSVRWRSETALDCLSDGCSGVERQPHGKRASLSYTARDVNRPAVLFDDVAHARQTNACARNRARHISAAMKMLEDARQVGGRDAQPMVAHHQDRHILIPLHKDRNRSASRAELDRIAEQVAQHPSQARGVPTTDELGFTSFDLKRMTVSDHLLFC